MPTGGNTVDIGRHQQCHDHHSAKGRLASDDSKLIDDDVAKPVDIDDQCLLARSGTSTPTTTMEYQDSDNLTTIKVASMLTTDDDSGQATYTVSAPDRRLRRRKRTSVLDRDRPFTTGWMRIIADAEPDDADVALCGGMKLPACLPRAVVEVDKPAAMPVTDPFVRRPILVAEHCLHCRRCTTCIRQHRTEGP